jgi:TPP-dependent pyruvate/acetoin dehydrogenase alpha subunit
VEADLNRAVSEIVEEAIAFADASEYPSTAEVLTDVW